AEPPGHSDTARPMWDALQVAFAGEPGDAFFRHAVVPRQGRRSPGIAILHPALGLFVIECCGYLPGQVAGIEGDNWLLAGVDAGAATPMADLLDQAAAVRGRLEEGRQTRGLACIRAALALPYLNRAQWQASGFPAVDAPILLEDDLDPAALRKALEQ